MRRLLALSACCLLLGACTIIDVRAESDPARIESRGLISFLASAGWPESESLLTVGLLEGRSPWTLVSFELWPVVRAEVGFIGAAVGVGPFDLGLGVLGYQPRPRSAESEWWWDEDEHVHVHIVEDDDD